MLFLRLFFVRAPVRGTDRCPGVESASVSPAKRDSLPWLARLTGRFPRSSKLGQLQSLSVKDGRAANQAPANNNVQAAQLSSDEILACVSKEKPALVITPPPDIPADLPEDLAKHGLFLARRVRNAGVPSLAT